jgi:hypothetical protein
MAAENQALRQIGKEQIALQDGGNMARKGWSGFGYTKSPKRAKKALLSVNLGRKEHEEHSRGEGRSKMRPSSSVKGGAQTLNRQEAEVKSPRAVKQLEK